MNESVSQRKYALASLVIGAGLARGDLKGFGIACGVLIVYYAVNVFEKRRR